MILGLMLLAVQKPSPNLIRNGDFSQGARGFVSGYRKSDEISMAGTYAVGNNSLKFHSGAASISDHTSGKGNMLLVNGSTSGGTIWSQQVKVQPGENYVFTGWAASWGNSGGGDPNPASLATSASGQLLRPEFLLGATSGEWRQFRFEFNSGSLRSVTLKISDMNIQIVGNDFALDDLELRKG